VTQSELITALGDLELVTIGANDAGDLYIDNVVLASKVRRRLTINHAGADFHGKLRPRGRCAKRNRVVVYRKKRGRDARVGRDKTNRRGRYSVREPDPRRGVYYAKVRASFAVGAGNCLAAKSKALRIGRRA
jgi:hypothetical protein